MLVVVPLVLHRQRMAEMATVDAHVTIGDAGSANRGEPSASRYRWPDSEVPRTVERLRDVTALAIAASTNVVDYAMHNRVPASADAILRDIAARGLIPPEWLTNQSGVLQMPHATVHLRYSPRDLTVEVISVPNERIDGPAILIRIPDAENTSVGNRYFESLQLDGINYPAPFAPIAQIIASGWQPRPFKQSQISDDQRAQLEQWSSAQLAAFIRCLSCAVMKSELIKKHDLKEIERQCRREITDLIAVLDQEDLRPRSTMNEAYMQQPQ